MNIGTMIKASSKSQVYIDRFAPLGIESIQLHFWETIPPECNKAWIQTIAEHCKIIGVKISGLSLFTNPFAQNKNEMQGEENWTQLLELAEAGAIELVSGFTGRVPHEPLEASFGSVHRFFTPILERCISKGITLAFENCPMNGNRESGDWNIAFLPEVWEMLFNDFFDDESCGLEFDPSHCCDLDQNPIKLAEEWKRDIVHVHGKDCSIATESGFCFPGEGACDWDSLYKILRSGSRCSAIDIEGYHRSFVSHEYEVALQESAVNYLKSIRNQN